MYPKNNQPRSGRAIVLVGGVVLSGHAAAIDTTAPYYMQILQGLTEAPTRDLVIPWQPDVNDADLMSNAEAPVPPQCYTDISEGSGTVGRHNPCYACHQNEVPGRENKQNDRQLQEAYSFSDVGLTNHWFNLFEDRSARVAAISDTAILDWIDDDNYSELAGRLQAAGWGNDDFSGAGTSNAAIYGEPWLPDLANLQEGAAAFDARGVALDGSWWVAFNYKPLPSTFWPTNGSTDDVMIRLAPGFWKTRAGVDSYDVYWANLALVEANAKGLDRIDSFPIDEVAIGQDVNADGVLQTGVTEVVLATNRKTTVEGEKNFYVGLAGETEFIEPSMYPLGTEFLHSVRYIGVDGDGNISVARRMKELRYMRRFDRPRLFNAELLYQEEAFEKELGSLPTFLNHGHSGLAKYFGWQVVGFIEAYDGRLRMNTYEENAFCMGCHSAVGATIDKTFRFPRKVDGVAGWGYINLRGMRDVPNRGESLEEVATYFNRVGGGSEFRSNPELESRFYHADGSVNTIAVASAKDVYELITPSRERALALNKAYKVIVEDQDFIFGRDATAVPPPRVLPVVDNDTSPTLAPEFQFDWNIVLDWSQADAMCQYSGDVDFAQLGGAAHVVELAGSDADGYAQVCTRGTVALTGPLSIALNDGYVPVPGDSFAIVKAASISGEFAETALPELPVGSFRLSQSAEQVQLEVIVDSDGDRLSDAEEAAIGTNPNLADTDGDGVSDFDELNRDGVFDSYLAGVDTDPGASATVALDPAVADPRDTDGDGFFDGIDPQPLNASVIPTNKVPMPPLALALFALVLGIIGARKLKSA